MDFVIYTSLENKLKFKRAYIFGSGMFFLNQFGTSLPPHTHILQCPLQKLKQRSSSLICRCFVFLVCCHFIRKSRPVFDAGTKSEAKRAEGLKLLTSPLLHSHSHYARGGEKYAQLLSLVCTLVDIVHVLSFSLCTLISLPSLKKHCRQSFYKESIFSFAQIIWWWFTSVFVFSRENMTEAVSFRGCRYDAAHQQSLSVISIFFASAHR